MKILAIQGSPRKNGHCAALMNQVLMGAEQAGHEVLLLSLNDMNIKGCQGCQSCRNGSTDCVLEDDLKEYWLLLRRCDALVLAAPNYCSLVCGPMLTFMNRHYCILDDKGKTRLLPGKKLIAIFSQGNDDKEVYIDTYNHFLGDFEYRGFQRHALMIHAGMRSVAPELLKEAYEAGQTLG